MTNRAGRNFIVTAAIVVVVILAIMVLAIYPKPTTTTQTTSTQNVDWVLIHSVPVDELMVLTAKRVIDAGIQKDDFASRQAFEELQKQTTEACAKMKLGEKPCAPVVATKALDIVRERYFVGSQH